jgi:hypothetical protein
MLTSLAAAFGVLVAVASVDAAPPRATEPNPPVWPSSVHVFDPKTPGASQQIIDAAFQQNGGHSPPFNGQWSAAHYAFLFLPGTHDVNVNVGYYTSVMGLGKARTDTQLANVECDNGDYNYAGGALDNFWRSVENLAVPGDMQWAVSQAAPLRRVAVGGNLNLWQYNSGCCDGYASGGFLADSVVRGTITSGSQQQWITRNTQMGGWAGGVFSMAFLGNSGDAPNQTHCNVKPMPWTVGASTPVIAEKPFIYVDPATGLFILRVPRVEFNKVGPSADGDAALADDYAFDLVYVTKPGDSAATINAKLDAGLHVVVTPGAYALEDSLRVTVAGTVVLGIGMPIVIAAAGLPALIVRNVDGVRVGGLLFQAGAQPTDVLVRWGDSDTPPYAGDPANPSFFHDAFARVGGANNPAIQQVTADVMLQVNSGNVVIDNAWLWRADHDLTGGVTIDSQNPCLNGLVVNGDNVSAYGLAVEHTLRDLVVWNGEYGYTFFYQSELPYDVTQDNFGAPGFVGYRVAPNVQFHSLFAGGARSV